PGRWRRGSRSLASSSVSSQREAAWQHDPRVPLRSWLMARTPLSSVDAAWLRMEDPTNLMMVTGLLVFDERLDPSAVRQVIEERLLGFPRFRQRVAEAPLGMRPPPWSSDRRFELDAHLHRVALPEPGDKGALEAF